MKVLVADDSKSMRELLQSTLKGTGYEVVVVEDGKQAFDEIRRSDIRLAILDWEMPCMSGPEVCRRVLGENPSNLIHMIILTSKKGTDDTVAALQSGASDFICKPFNTDELLARVRVGERIINLQSQISSMQVLAERKRSDEEITKSELKFRTVADFTWDWEFWMSPDGRFIYISPSCERISGYAPSEFIDDPTLFFRIAHAENAQDMKAEMEKAFSLNKQDSFDFMIVCKDRRVRWVSMAYQPVGGENGIFLGVRGSIRDITERKQTEREVNLLQTITMSVAEAESFHSALDVVLREVCNATGWVYGEAWIPNGDTELLERQHVYCKSEKLNKFTEVSDGIAFQKGMGLPGRAWESKQPLWVEDVTKYKYFLRAPIAGAVGLKTGIAFPILNDDEVVSVVVFYKLETTERDERLIGLVTAVMTQLGSIIKKKQAEEAIVERSRLSALIADTGIALIQRGSLRETLQKCCEAMVRNLDVEFARIWTLNEEGAMLELQSSAGLYTHVNGPHGRIPVGKYKIGLIALERKPHLTNFVIGDPRISDQEWARKMGMMSFAGYPMIIDDCLVGVIAMFAKNPLSRSILKALESVSDSIALCIKRKQIENSLYLAHRQTEQLIAAIPSILIYIDEGGKIKEWNKVAEKVFGIQLADVIGKPLNACGITWHDREVVERISECRNTLQPTRIDDIRFKNPIGKPGFLGITVNPIKEGEDKQPGLLIIGSDITQRKIMENQLIQAQKLESIGQLAAGIAHEINTPTQYVGDNTQFLKDAFDDLCKASAKYRELLGACKAGIPIDALVSDIEAAEKDTDVEYLLEEIPKAIHQSLEGIERISKIVRAMKEFSYPCVNEKTPIDINRAIESTITVSRNEWKYVADIVTVFDSSLPAVLCHPDEFNQVILNVIVNAAHAIGGVNGNGSRGKGIITVSTQRDGDFTMVRIQDTGTGIPDEIRSRIFDPFFTTKEVGKGTGQGLSIAHDIVVKKHGGTIDFETAMGKGTTFIIRIPINGSSGAA